MNTPEKLKMLGFRKADPDAELKRVRPKAWQGISISPLYDRATKGDGGSVIWTGLCFDRKQFVAAFGGEPPPSPPTARAQPQRDRAKMALDALYPNGVPGRASKSDAELVLAVNIWLKNNELFEVSRESILRAAGRRK